MEKSGNRLCIIELLLLSKFRKIAESKVDLSSSNPAANRTELSEPTTIPRLNSFSPDARWFASGYQDGTVRVWDLADPDSPAAPIVLPGHSGEVIDISFSPDSRWLATVGADRTALMWEIAASNPAVDPLILEESGGGVTEVAFSPKGHWLVTGSEDVPPRLWDMTASDPSGLSHKFLG
jgi:WD40 repeat protein